MRSENNSMIVELKFDWRIVASSSTYKNNSDAFPDFCRTVKAQLVCGTCLDLPLSLLPIEFSSYFSNVILKCFRCNLSRKINCDRGGGERENVTHGFPLSNSDEPFLLPPAFEYQIKANVCPTREKIFTSETERVGGWR